MRTLFRSMWFWPMFIIIFVVGTALVTLVSAIAVTEVATAIRPEVVMVFLFICPGMAVVRFFRLTEAVDELVLAVALSFAIGAFVAGILLYAGRWSPVSILDILLGICLVGAALQLLMAFSSRIKSARPAPREQQAHLKKI